MTPDQAAAAYILARSGENDLHRAWADQMWRLGHAAGLAAAADAYEAGFADGLLFRKQLEHATVTELRGELARWDGPRERFGDPRPGDFPGTAARQAGAA